MKRTRRVLLSLSFLIAAPGYAQVGVQAPAAPAPTLKDPIELCAKLGGTEREICMRQARETRRPGDPIGSTSPQSGGSGSAAASGEKDKRGNTPPGSDRAGSAPVSGAIVDPAGVTKK